MDTKLKYNILTEYLGRICSNRKEKYLYSLMTFSHEHEVFKFYEMEIPTHYTFLNSKNVEKK